MYFLDCISTFFIIDFCMFKHLMQNQNINLKTVDDFYLYKQYISYFNELTTIFQREKINIRDTNK